MEEMELCLERGAKITDMIHADGCKCGQFWRNGYWQHLPLCLDAFVDRYFIRAMCGAGKRTGFREGIRHKYNVLKQSVNHYAGDGSAKDIIAWFGGYEMVMGNRAACSGQQIKMIILVDGFHHDQLAYYASKLHPEVLSYAIFGHQEMKPGHKLVLDAMKVRPLLNLGLRLGEGTGAICAYPIVVSSVNMMNEMDNFAHAPSLNIFNHETACLPHFFTRLPFWKIADVPPVYFKTSSGLLALCWMADGGIMAGTLWITANFCLYK